MKNSLINSVIMVFTFVLAGLIAVQVYWLKTAIDLKEKQFNSTVLGVLQNVVKRVEGMENAQFAEQSISGDTTIIKKSKSKTRQFVKVFSSNSTIHGKKNRLNSKDSIVVHIEEIGNGECVDEEAEINSPDELITAITNDSSKHVEDKIKNVGVLIKKLIWSGKGREEIINGPELENILIKELKENNLNLNPEIAVTNANKVFYTNAKDIAVIKESLLSVDLYPNDILERNARLYLYFPSKFNYLLGDVLLSLVLALLFTTTIIFVFAYTLINLRKQKKLNDIKTEFINNVMHELKTPLASVQLASDLIYNNAEKIDIEALKNISRVIKSQSVKMTADITSILQNVLMENKNYNLAFKIVPVGDIVNEAIEEIEMLAMAKNITIKHDLGSARAIMVNADKTMMVKALVNLLDNAIKYSDDSSVVAIESITDNGRILLKVKDEGRGIKQEDAPHIFDKFYRGQKGNIHDTKGYGLGLSFVKTLIELHNGTITVNSVLGKGCEFIINLPEVNNES